MTDQNAEKVVAWEAGASHTKDRAFGASVQVDATGIYLSANLGRRFLYALRSRKSPAKEGSDD